MLQEGLAPKVKTNIGFVLAAEFAKEWDRRSPKTVPNNGPRPSVSVSMAASRCGKLTAGPCGNGNIFIFDLKVCVFFFTDNMDYWSCGLLATTTDTTTTVTTTRWKKRQKKKKR
ncbi:hypothetical protein TWF106_003415 [Orbilia oligospora]|uniref:Uncharacterized protein n=1 Tax=Orbilia oligospora TaxID=2813651 RepID=A0A6G1MCZ9_ORBOL|nr:hypothetical protein TWF788_010928 [Orbilia oligospora]KAF3200244.1 hypothetical protein TWF106_003415 [Orbilia oligospora]KAF3205548.1 hypothetical protein TWF679_009309 [Orbilia oligospora]KAF3230672.1 hypothetical protein TWF191_009580 [Orbilia oligospora]KAF3254053.1 hypothetical protein TWF192_003564 [Orbilia oligospora]